MIRPLTCSSARRASSQTGGMIESTFLLPRFTEV